MSKKLFYISIIVASILTVFLIGFSVKTNSNTSPLPNNDKSSDYKFRLISKNDAGEYVSYTFHSNENLVFNTYDDCIGCPPYEDGNIGLWRQFMSKKKAEDIFDGYEDSGSNWEMVKGSFSDKNNVKRKIVSLRDEANNEVVVRILWIAPSKRTHRYWFIQAPNVEIAKAFEESEIFQKHKALISFEPPTCNTYGVNSANYDWCP